MTTQNLHDAIASYSIGGMGGFMGITITGADILMWASAIMLVARFAYDTTRFVHYLRDRKKGIYRDN